MEEEIKDKIKSISCKTKNLKTLSAKVPELSLLNAADKVKTPKDCLNSSDSTKTIGSDQTGTSAASSGIKYPTDATISLAIPTKSSTTTMAVIGGTSAEDNLLICVKNKSLLGDETIPERVVQQMDEAVIVTVIEIFFFFSFFRFHFSFIFRVFY